MGQRVAGGQRVERIVLRLLTAAVMATSAACGADGSTMEVRARASLTDEAGLAGLHLRIGDADFSASSFRPDQSGAQELFLRVPDQGSLRIEVQLDQAGAVVASGVFQVDMEPDFEWGMDIFRQAPDPVDTCLGCTGSRGFQIQDQAQAAPGETLWLVWGGRPRGSDVVF